MSANNLPKSAVAILEEIKASGQGELALALEGFGKAVAKREAEEQEQKPEAKPEAQTEPKDEPKGQLLLFPEWADTRRASASAVFRSALFPALARGKRQYLEEVKIFSTRGVTVCFTGKQFDQSDLDVYLEIVHILREQPFGTYCTFSAYGLLKAIGRSTGRRDYRWLHSVITRLTACSVDITDGRARYFGSLLEGGRKDEITKHYILRVNPDFARLLKYSWSSLDSEQRLKLRGNPTAQALHAYYSGHAGAGAHEFETLAGLVGLTNKTNKRMLKARLIKAHEFMKEKGYLKDYTITGSTIRSFPNHTPSQNRYIAGQIVKERKKKQPESVKS